MSYALTLRMAARASTSLPLTLGLSQGLIEWRTDDRYVRVEFIQTGTGVIVRQTFDAEATPPVDEQRLAWQPVLDSFTRHVVAIQ